MRNQPLPKRVDVRKLAAATSEIQAAAPLSAFPRFGELLTRSEGEVEVSMAFRKDEHHRLCIKGELSARPWLQCQRCLQPLQVDVSSSFHLAMVLTDEQAVALPKWLEPVLADPETLDLFGVVEEELLVSVPFVSYHEEDCAGEYRAPETEPVPEAPKENPFAALSALKGKVDD